MGRAADGYREKARGSFRGECERCGEPLEWDECEVHHVDRDRSNDNDDNLEPLCITCHVDAHNGEDPLWRLVVSMPRPVLESVDAAVERRGYSSRSEAVVRAVAAAYGDLGSGPAFNDAERAASAWFTGDDHTKWVSDAAHPPGCAPDTDQGGDRQ